MACTQVVSATGMLIANSLIVRLKKLEVNIYNNVGMMNRLAIS